MSVSRRTFLWNGAFVAAACAASPFEALGQQRRSLWEEPSAGQPASVRSGSATFDPYAALEQMDRNLFTSAVGSDFRLLSALPGSSTVSLRLLAVKDLPGPPAPDPNTYVTRNLVVNMVGTSGFMLLFSTTSPDILSQGSYTFSHDRLGQFVMFIVPEGLGKGQYSAIVNRLDVPPVLATPISASGGTQTPAATGSVPGSTTNGGAGASSRPAQRPASTSSDNESPFPPQGGTRVGRKAVEKD